MSGFYTLELVPESIQPSEIGNYVFNVLLPFDELYEFPPFRIPCECTGIARSIGIDEANTKVGNFHVLWRKYSQFPKDDCPDWRQYIKIWERTAIHTARSYPHYEKPDRRCELCKGTGVYETKLYPGQLYDCWALSDWINLGPADQVPYDPYGYSILLDNGELFYRWGLFKRYSEEEWKETVSNLLNSSTGYIAIKCLMHK